MNSIYRFFCVAWKIFFTINFILSLLLLYPLFYILIGSGNSFNAGFKLLGLWGRYLITVPGIGLKVIHETELPKGPYIICPNHSSYLDIILMYVIFPDYFITMGKKELGDMPVFNVFFKKLNILVDRKSISGSHKAFLRAGAEIDKGHSMAIYPEGTISKKAPVLGKFKNGVFKLAAEKQVPIIPVTFANNWKILGSGPFFKSKCGPGKANVYVHAPVTVASPADAHIEEAKAKVYALLQGKISEYLQYNKLAPLSKTLTV